MTKKYKFDESPNCPSCGRIMEKGLVAIDFVVCDKNGIPIGSRSKDRCGWCNETYLAFPNEEKTHIIFTNELT